VILLVLIVIAIVGADDRFHRSARPNGLPFAHPTLDAGNWFGQTYFGEDVFAQFANGLRASFFVGLLGGAGVRYRDGRRLHCRL